MRKKNSIRAREIPKERDFSLFISLISVQSTRKETQNLARSHEGEWVTNHRPTFQNVKG